MAEWFNALKNAIMGQEDEYETYEEEEYVEDNAEEYAEEAQNENHGFGFSKIKSFASFGKAKTADGAVAPAPSKSYASSYSGGYSSYSRNSAPKVVSLNANVSIQVVVTTPRNLEEASEVCDELKNKKTVIVNLEDCEAEMAQRIADFFIGASYALDGSVQPVSGRIIIIGPYGVNITGQFKEELEAASGLKLSGSSRR
ncbi:MAG: cell division protein SepF [Firmicutes bacterium]|nr:cell division protein SepF [Bacillota bacterium]